MANDLQDRPGSAYQDREAGGRGLPSNNLGSDQNQPSRKKSDPCEEGAQHDDSDPRDDLRNREQSGGESTGGDGQKAYSPDNIKGREQFSNPNSRYNAGGDQSDKDSLFNAGGDEGGRFGKAKTGLQNFRGKIKGYAKNKWLVGGMAVGGTSLFVLIFLLILIAGSLKIPNLAQHIEEYQMARVIRQFSETSNKITNEKLAIDSVDEASQSRIKTNYENLRNNTWGRLDKYRPAKVIENMKGTEQLKLNYSSSSILGRERLTSVTFAGEEFPVKNQGYTRFIPGVSGAIDFKNKYTFSKDFAPFLTESLKADSTQPIMRGLIARQIRKELGVNLIAWKVADYAGKDEAKARLQAARDSYKAVAKPGVDPATSQPIAEATKAADETLQEDLKDDAKTQAIIDNGGSDPAVEKVIEEKVAPTNFKNVVGFLNPAFGGAIAGCIIYDGSLTASGPSINAGTDSQQRAGYLVQKAADQQKRGGGSGEAVGAFNDQLGDISGSVPEIRAATGVQNTSAAISSEASAGGDFSILDVLLGSGPAGVLANGTFQAACPVLTNIYVGVGGAVVLAALALVPGVGEAEGAADAAIDTSVSALAKRIVSNLATKAINKEATSRARAKTRFIVKDTLVSGAKVASLTILAKLITMNKSHQMYNGLDQGTDFADMADSGWNLQDSTLEQRQFYGRPLTTSEAAADQEANNRFVADSHKKDSLYMRYFALSNPASLVNRFAILTANTLRVSQLQSFVNMGGKLLTPLHSLNTLFGSTFIPRAVAAANVTSTGTFYGNVQWGYSPQEMNILRTDFTYRPLENQDLLDKSGREGEIDDKYSQCFDGSVSIGDMLAEGLIVRNKDGDVDPNKGDCAPNKLGPNNNEFGPQMVFRWRVAHNYSNGIDQLLDEQEVTP